MDGMVKHGLVPNIEHSVIFESLLETVRAKRAQADSQETESSGDPKKCNGHVTTSRRFEASPTVFDH